MFADQRTNGLGDCHSRTKRSELDGHEERDPRLADAPERLVGGGQVSIPQEKKKFDGDAVACERIGPHVPAARGPMRM